MYNLKFLNNWQNHFLTLQADRILGYLGLQTIHLLCSLNVHKAFYWASGT